MKEQELLWKVYLALLIYSQTANSAIWSTTIATASTTCSTTNILQEGYEQDVDNPHIYYKFYHSDTNYNDAKEICQKLGARLAMFKTEPEFLLAKKYADGYNVDIWVGVDNFDMVACQDQSNNLKPCTDLLFWSDGTKLITQSWMSTFDANHRTPCFRIRPGGHVGDRLCWDTMPFLCQFNCTNVYSAPSPNCPNPEGMTKYDHATEKHYEIINSDDILFAQSDCNRMNGTLAVLKNVEDFRFLMKIAASTNVGFGIGLLSSGRFPCLASTNCSEVLRYIDGSPFVQEPWLDIGFVSDGSTNTFKDACASIIYNTNLNTYEFIIRNCSSWSHFICEYRCSQTEGNVSQTCFKDNFVNFFGINFLSTETFAASKDEARLHCQTKWSNENAIAILPEFRDENEYDALNLFIQRVSPYWLSHPSFFIGLSISDRTVSYECNNTFDCKGLTWDSDNSEMIPQDWMNHGISASYLSDWEIHGQCFKFIVDGDIHVTKTFCHNETMLENIVCMSRCSATCEFPINYVQNLSFLEDSDFHMGESLRYLSQGF